MAPRPWIDFDGSTSEEQARVTAASIVAALRVASELSATDGSSEQLDERFLGKFGRILSYLSDGGGEVAVGAGGLAHCASEAVDERAGGAPPAKAAEEYGGQ
jgi:hypothetical protein